MLVMVTGLSSRVDLSAEGMNRDGNGGRGKGKAVPINRGEGVRRWGIGGTRKGRAVLKPRRKSYTLIMRINEVHFVISSCMQTDKFCPHLYVCLEKSTWVDENALLLAKPEREMFLLPSSLCTARTKNLKGAWKTRTRLDAIRVFSDQGRQYAANNSPKRSDFRTIFRSTKWG